MANAMLANLPPVYGLYGGIIPVFIHSLFTGSYQLHVGPYAIGSLMCASFLSFIDYETEIEEFVSATVTLAFLSGAILVLLSFLRLGIVTRVLSDAVVTAFTASSAIQLLSSQIGGYWGVSTGTGSPLKQVIILFSPSTIQNYNWYAFIIGITSSILLYVGKELNKKYCPKVPLPLELFLVVLFVFLNWGFNLKAKWNIKIIGDYEVVKGFPPFSHPAPKYLLQLIPGAIIIAIICFSTDISLGKSFAQQFNYRLDDNQEMFALGICQVAGSFFSSLPCTVSITRSSVVANIGGKSPLFSLMSPLVVLFCLFFLMDWIAYLPNSVLVTIVLVNLIGVFKRFSVLPKLYRCSRPDFWSFVACTVVLVFFGAEYGLLAGVCVSLILLALSLKTIKKEKPLPPVTYQGEIVDAGVYLHFLNRDKLIDKIHSVILESPPSVCIDLRKIQYIDTSGLNAISVQYMCMILTNRKLMEFFPIVLVSIVFL